jgi:WD40 repeat protein
MVGDIHSSPVFSPDGLEAYWGTWKTGIHFSRLENGYWTKPQRLAFSDPPAVDRDPFLAPSGERLFFISTAPLPGQGQPGKENVWFVDRTATGWGDPQPLNDDINSYDLHWQVSVDNQGNLYFGARQGGCHDIFFSRYSNGQYGKAERLGDTVNTTDFCEESPYIALDGSYLIFSRWDEATHGAVIQLYISYADQDGNWSEASLIPRVAYGNCPLVSPEGKYLIFLSSPHSVSWMRADFIEELRTPQAKPDLSSAEVISATSLNRVERFFTLTGHTDRVIDVAFSRQSGYLASCSWDGTIRVWDLQNRRELYSLPVREPDLNCIAFSPDSRRLASAEAIWDLESGQELFTLEQGLMSPGRVAFSPDGSLLAVAVVDRYISIWDLTSGQLLRRLDPQSGNSVFFDLEFSPNGESVYASTHGGQVWSWNLASGQVTGVLDEATPEDDIHDIEIAQGGGLLASGGTGPSLHVWDLARREILLSMPNYSGMYGMDLSPDDSILAVAGPSRTIELWDVATGRKLKSLPHADELLAVEFSPDGRLIASGGYDHTIVVWGIPQ